MRQVDGTLAVLLQPSLIVRAIIAQRLVPRVGGTGRIAALEILLNTPRIQALVRRGELDPTHAEMLSVRRKEGNQALFRASGELGEPVRSYVARLLALEEILSSLPVRK